MLSVQTGPWQGLNESPSEKEGKCRQSPDGARAGSRLNESPSEKEGKL